MADPRGYQLHLSKGDFVLKNTEGRTQKFKKIFSVLRDFCPEHQSLKCLDIGCSSGIITSLLGQALSMTIGMDIDQEAVNYAKKHHLSSRIQFLTADAMSLPFKDGSSDVIICKHLYEHVPNAYQMMEEIFRVLKEDGFCYFSAGNKYMIMEGPYVLPFLSWLPKPLAHLYLKMMRKGNLYYEKHLSLWGLKKLVKRFCIRDYTLPIIKDPEKVSATDLFNPQSFSYKWIRSVAPYLYPWIPTSIWVLTKKG
jgi:2-polyprenyl-3-methyl-5-hydroxy-6-metoxy-1,4-benzoquinol methylase